ncbi:MAG TPA: efflux RND transporter periplasmic adaptor subunit [Bryobacteraceae bacterium]|nr:efflux RND transporter periplasmic adaptor subunit [Bryobacteraceae bacterium]
MSGARYRLLLACGGVAAAMASLAGCSSTGHSETTASAPETEATVGVTTVTRKPIMRDITISSELVPYQEIDVYAKESGYVTDLRVDYGSRVEKGQLMATLEIPELAADLKRDTAAIDSAKQFVNHAQKEADTLKAQREPVHDYADRIASVAKAQKGLVAQQEIDDAQGKDLALGAQIEAAEASYQDAVSRLDEVKARQEHDQALYEYAKITAPFAGVVTERYANLGTLMQAGTGSSTQALPLVQLSEDDVFRLVIPVPESYVKYIRVGDPVKVNLSSLGKVVSGTVKRFSEDVAADTRTMHTEVDVPNPAHVLMPGMYAEATLTLDRKEDALVAPLQAISQAGTQATAFVVGAGDILQERKIELGMQTATDADVLSGLNEGDRVVVSDTSGLKAGAHVKPQQVQVLGDQTSNSQ